MTILLALDLNDAPTVLLKQAKAFAQAFKQRLVLLTVENLSPDMIGYDVVTGEAIISYTDIQPIRDGIAQRLRNEHQHLHAVMKECQDEGIDCTALLINNSPDFAKSILAQAEKHQASMILLGKHPKSLMSRLLEGSVSADVLKHSTIPVVIVPIVDSLA